MPRNGRPSLNVSKRTNTQFPLTLRDELVSLGKLKPLRDKKNKKNRNKRGGATDNDRNSTNNTKKRRPSNQDYEQESSAAEEEPSLKRRKTETTKTKTTKKTALQKLVERTSGERDDSGSDSDDDPDNNKFLSQAEVYEDQEINWLEHQLGLKKGKQSGRKQFEEDGLDDLMDDLDSIQKSTKKLKKKQVQQNLLSSEEYGEEDEESDEEESNEEYDGNGMEESEEHDDGINLDEDFSNDEKASDKFSESKEVDVKDKRLGKIKESESSQKMNKNLTDSQIQGTRYIPPQLRNKDLSKSDNSSIQDIRFRKILLGHLNRLSSSNVAATLSEIEQIYLDHPRAVVSSSIVDLLIDIISGRDNLGLTFIVTYAALVSLLCRIVGKELVSAILSKAVYHYDRPNIQTSTSTPLSAINAAPSAGKQKANIVTFISELYNLHVVECSIMYEIVKELVKDLDENAIDMLLRIVQNCGSQLRRDDPTSLKEIVRMVKEKQSKIPAEQISSRARFMVERLSDLKGNRIKEVSNPASEARNSLKKFISQLSKQRSFTPLAPLQYTLEGLREKAVTGKFWNVSQLNNKELAEIKKNKKDISQKIKKEEEAMMQLARSHGMNTEVRRSIFVNLLNSEDCMDARERILSLGLNDVQKRDIVRVILHCVEMENTFNPYYPLVLEKIINSGSAYTRSLQITLQFCLWDFFRETGEQGLTNKGDDSLSTHFSNHNEKEDISLKRRIRNLSQTYAWCVAKAGLSLSILKPLRLFSLRSTTETFVKNLLKYVVLYTQVPTPVIMKSTVDKTKKNTSLIKDPSAITNIFANIAEIGVLVDGMLWFIENKMYVSTDAEEMDKLDDYDEIDKAGLRIGVRTLQRMGY